MTDVAELQPMGGRERPCAVRLTLDVVGLREVNGSNTICVTLRGPTVPD